MQNEQETENTAYTEWLRFRCPVELKKAIGHLAVDEGSEQAVCNRLLAEAVEREEKRKKRTA